MKLLSGLELKMWAIDKIGDIIRAGGKLVSKEVQEERLKACQKCPHSGIVNPLPTIKVEGCKFCKCPHQTKLKTESYFDITKGKIVTTECSNIEKGNGIDFWSHIKQ